MKNLKQIVRNAKKKMSKKEDLKLYKKFLNVNPN